MENEASNRLKFHCGMSSLAVSENLIECINYYLRIFHQIYVFLWGCCSCRHSAGAASFGDHCCGKVMEDFVLCCNGKHSLVLLDSTCT